MTACGTLITSRSAACIIPQILWDLVKNDNSILHSGALPVLSLRFLGFGEE